MQIERTGASELTITGNIKSTADFLSIRDLVTETLWGGGREVTVRIHESLSMPSSVIGFFVKLVNRDKVRLILIIQDPRLLELIDELSLTSTFGARLA